MNLEEAQARVDKINRSAPEKTKHFNGHWYTPEDFEKHFGNGRPAKDAAEALDERIEAEERLENQLEDRVETDEFVEALEIGADAAARAARLRVELPERGVADPPR